MRAGTRGGLRSKRPVGLRAKRIVATPRPICLRKGSGDEFPRRHMPTLIGAATRSESGNGVHKDRKLTLSAMVCSVTTGSIEASRSMPAGVRNDDDEGAPHRFLRVGSTVHLCRVTTRVYRGEEIFLNKGRVLSTLIPLTHRHCTDTNILPYDSSRLIATDTRQVEAL
jgi:hypothetical protein